MGPIGEPKNTAATVEVHAGTSLWGLGEVDADPSCPPRHEEGRSWPLVSTLPAHSPPRRRGFAHLVVLTTLMMIVSVIGVSPASADPYGTGGSDTGWLPDGLQHTYCWGASFTQSAFRSAANGRMNNLANQTVMNVLRHTSCGSTTDVRFELISGTTEPRGRYLCLNRIGNVCTRARVQLNTTHLTNTVNRLKTTCHEIGHSVGMTHGGTSDCMRNGAVTTSTQTYNSHHVNHVNSYFQGCGPCQ